MKIYMYICIHMYPQTLEPNPLTPPGGGVLSRVPRTHLLLPPLSPEGRISGGRISEGRISISGGRKWGRRQ